MIAGTLLAFGLSAIFIIQSGIFNNYYSSIGYTARNQPGTEILLAFSVTLALNFAWPLYIYAKRADQNDEHDMQKMFLSIGIVFGILLPMIVMIVQPRVVNILGILLAYDVVALVVKTALPSTAVDALAQILVHITITTVAIMVNPYLGMSVGVLLASITLRSFVDRHDYFI